MVTVLLGIESLAVLIIELVSFSALSSKLLVANT